MDETKLDMQLERKVQSGKEDLNYSKLEGKSEYEFKKTNNKGKEEKRKIIKVDEPRIEEDMNKNGFLVYKNISGKESNFKRKKGDIKKNKKNNYKRNGIIMKNNSYLIIMILFNLIIINNSMIEYKSSSITLKIKANGFQYILSENFFNNHPPDNMKINGVDKTPLDCRHDFRERMDNTVKLTWNNPLSNFEDMFRGCATITEIDFSEFVISGVTTMKSMFFGCSKLSSLDLSKFANSNPSDITNMFKFRIY